AVFKFQIVTPAASEVPAVATHSLLLEIAISLTPPVSAGCVSTRGGACIVAGHTWTAGSAHSISSSSRTAPRLSSHARSHRPSGEYATLQMIDESCAADASSRDATSHTCTP